MSDNSPTTDGDALPLNINLNPGDQVVETDSEQVLTFEGVTDTPNSQLAKFTGPYGGIATFNASTLADDVGLSSNHPYKLLTYTIDPMVLSREFNAGDVYYRPADDEFIVIDEVTEDGCAKFRDDMSGRRMAHPRALDREFTNGDLLAANLLEAPGLATAFRVRTAGRSASEAVAGFTQSTAESIVGTKDAIVEFIDDIDTGLASSIENIGDGGISRLAEGIVSSLTPDSDVDGDED